MSIEGVIRERDIREILHFTTNKGLLGILDSKAIKSRAKLCENQRLEHILKLNTPTVKDPAWIDYVNLSITRINSTLYNISSNAWHQDDSWWCILSFDPVILTHQNVTFATTNNIFPATLRNQGETGLNALFSDPVLGYYSKRVRRPLEMSASTPTCEQAEVLYPGEISTDFLQRVYVQTDEEQDDAYGQLAAVFDRNIDVVVTPEKFAK